MKILPIATIAALGLSTIMAFAQTPTTFADVDTDASGELSFAELQVAWPDLAQAEFDAADADASGGLTAEELNGLQPPALTGEPTAPAPETPVVPAN